MLNETKEIPSYNYQETYMLNVVTNISIVYFIDCIYTAVIINLWFTDAICNNDLGELDGTKPLPEPMLTSY